MQAGFRGVGIRVDGNTRYDGVRAIGSRRHECRRTRWGDDFPVVADGRMLSYRRVGEDADATWSACVASASR